MTDTPSQQSVQEPRGFSFAERAAKAAFGRNYIPPPYRDFQDVTPATSKAARKAGGFPIERGDETPALGDLFAQAVKEMEAGA